MRRVVSAGSDEPEAIPVYEEDPIVVRGGHDDPLLVQEESSAALSTQDAYGQLVTTEPEFQLVRAQGDQRQVVLAGVRGMPGQKGDPGPAGGAAFVRVAGESLSALVAVYELPTGRVHPLSASDMEHIDLLAGITLTSAGPGADVTIQRSGVLEVAGLGLAPGRVWLGENGRMTQTPPAEGFDVLLGYATAEQRVYIDISESIELED